MTEYSLGAMVFSTILCAILSAVCALWFGVTDKYNDLTITSPKAFYSFGIAALTAWLWGPWLGFAVWWSACQSANGIQYLQRPPQVIPVERTTIDMNKTEQP